MFLVSKLRHTENKTEKLETQNCLQLADALMFDALSARSIDLFQSFA